MHSAKKAEKKVEANAEYRAKIKKVIKVLKRTKVYSREEEIRDYGGEYNEIAGGSPQKTTRSARSIDSKKKQ